jgi:hypothetical protein
MITVNVVNAYLNKQWINIPKRFETLFPADYERINVRCGIRLFNGHVERRNTNGAVRLCFNLGYSDINSQYRGFMENIGVGAALCFQAVNIAGNVIIEEGVENNGAIQELFLDTITCYYE